jgi:hypothetical protein
MKKKDNVIIEKKTNNHLATDIERVCFSATMAVEQHNTVKDIYTREKKTVSGFTAGRK